MSSSANDIAGQAPMDMHQHDGATMFQFVLRGELTGNRVQDLEHAWNTAKSILAGKELVVDVSGMTDADPSGVDLLSRMRESGARLTAAQPPESAEFIRSLGIPVAAPSGRSCGPRALRLVRLVSNVLWWRRGELNHNITLTTCNLLIFIYARRVKNATSAS